MIADGPLATRAGAALSMVPAAAEESVKRNEMPEHLVENLRGDREHPRPAAQQPRTAHLRLAGVHLLPCHLHANVNALQDAPEFRRDFAVHIDGYGPGRLSLLVS